MISLILTLALIGFILYLITTYVPMPEPIRIGIIAVTVIVLIIYLLAAFGIADVPLPQLRR